MTHSLLRAATIVAALATTTSAQHVELITNGVNGQSNEGSLYPEITADGRYIVFQSAASNLVPGDTNSAPDSFMFDRETKTTRRVTVRSDGSQANQGGLEPVISLDNRYVTFYSFSNDLVAGDTNGSADCFLHHLPTGATTRVSVATDGTQGNGGSRYPVLSSSGRYVAFESASNNLVPNDANGSRDVFLHDRVTGVTSRVSETAGGVEGNADSVDAFISPDGRYVVFESEADNLVPNDTNGVKDVFLKDLQTGVLTRVSVDTAGVEGNGISENASIDEGGSKVAFASYANNLVAQDANGYEDLFLRDLTSGVTERINLSTGGGQGHVGAYEPTLSPDGGFVVFFSAASNHVPGDSNSQLDVFVRDLVNDTTERVSVGDLGQQGFGECFYPAISPGGRYVVYDSASDNLILDDTNGYRDIFLYDRFSPFRPFCAGDGTQVVPCPCGNDGSPGRGCKNSSGGDGGALVASGDPEDDEVLLTMAGLPQATVVVFLQARNDNTPGVSFGDGVLCSSGAVRRLYTKAVVGGTVVAPGPGDPTILMRAAATGDPIQSGETRVYQGFYRDSTPFCTPAGFNATNGIEISW